MNEIAFRVTQEATGEAQPEPERKENPAAVALGKLGGLRVARRAAKLTPERRKPIAAKAARARWGKANDK